MARCNGHNVCIILRYLAQLRKPEWPSSSVYSYLGSRYRASLEAALANS